MSGKKNTVKIMSGQLWNPAGALPELSIKLPHGGAKCDTGTDCILGSLTSGKEGFNKKPIFDTAILDIMSGPLQNRRTVLGFFFPS